MRRGRIFIYIALIIVVIVAGVGIWWWRRNSTATPPTTDQPQATSQAQFVNIITAGQNIYPGSPITESMLNTIQIPQDQLVAGEFTNAADVVGMYAKISITQGVPIMSSMLSVSPGNVNLPGSTWAPFIPQGLTAVPIPITRLSSVAFGIRDGDYVNVIVTMLLVDVDPAYQTILPNVSSGVTYPNPYAQADVPLLYLVAQAEPAGVIEGWGDMGRTEYDETLEQPFYVTSSERQRARMVTQMILQNVQVLHVGNFPLPGEMVSDSLISPTDNPEATATPAVTDTEGTIAVITQPDIITLMVPNQDAVTLTWLIYSGAQINLTLRNPNDQVVGVQPDAATLEYLLTQYNIPVPAKLPYALEPRLNILQQPILPNDPVLTEER